MIASFTAVPPARMRRAIASPFARSLVNTDDPSPYTESFASRTASSTSRTLITGSVGPNVSSRMHAMSWFTFTSTVGS